MKWERHTFIGFVFAIPSVLLLLLSYGSLCSAIFVRLSCGYQINYEDLTLASVLAFIVATEFVLAYKRKSEGELFWESDSQKQLRKTGMLAMFVGMLAVIYGYLKTESSLVSSSLPWTVHNANGLSFYFGLLVMAFGTSFIFGSRFIKVRPIAAASPKLLQGN